VDGSRQDRICSIEIVCTKEKKNEPVVCITQTIAICNTSNVAYDIFRPGPKGKCFLMCHNNFC